MEKYFPQSCMEEFLMLSVLKMRAVVHGHLWILEVCVAVLVFVLNHFRKHNGAFAIDDFCITVLLPSKKIGFKGNCETFAAFWRD